MTKRNYDVPLVGICVFIRRNRKILLHKRKGDHGPGTWGAPGGHLEKWEEFEDCILREVAEECGPHFKITYPVFWTVENTMFKDEGRHYILLAFIADWISGEALVMEPDKCEVWEWFEWNNLPKPLMVGINQIFNKGLNPFYPSVA